MVVLTGRARPEVSGWDARDTSFRGWLRLGSFFLPTVPFADSKELTVADFRQNWVRLGSFWLRFRPLLLILNNFLASF